MGQITWIVRYGCPYAVAVIIATARMEDYERKKMAPVWTVLNQALLPCVEYWRRKKEDLCLINLKIKTIRESVVRKPMPNQPPERPLERVEKQQSKQKLINELRNYRSGFQKAWVKASMAKRFIRF